MMKFIAATIVGSAVLLSATEAFAGHGCHCGGGGYYAAPVAGAPVGSQGQLAAAPQGTRTYSYQPVQPVYRSYSRPMKGGRSTVRAYENGAFKSLGIGY